MNKFCVEFCGHSLVHITAGTDIITSNLTDETQRLLLYSQVIFADAGIYFFKAIVFITENLSEELNNELGM